MGMGWKHLLGIDETEGISLEEVEAIKSTLSRITVVLAEIAETNDTSETLQILKELESALRRAVRLGIFSVDDLHQRLALNSSGQTTAALGSGPSSHQPAAAQRMSATDHVNAILGDSTVDPGIRALFKRALVPNDPDPIRVEPDGTPVRLITAKQERDAAIAERDDARKERDAAEQDCDAAIVERDKAKRDLASQSDVSRMGSLAHQLAEMRAERDAIKTELAKAKQDLANERDESRNGSLAKQLAAAKANSTRPGSAPVYDKKRAEDARQEVYEAIDGLTALFGGLKGKDKLELKFGNLLSAVGLPKA